MLHPKIFTQAHEGQSIILAFLCGVGIIIRTQTLPIHIFKDNTPRHRTRVKMCARGVTRRINIEAVTMCSIDFAQMKLHLPHRIMVMREEGACIQRGVRDKHIARICTLQKCTIIAQSGKLQDSKM